MEYQNNNQPTNFEQVVLVNDYGEDLGPAEKMEAHRKGWRHRAFSIFLFNKKGQLLLQQRQFSKYHSGGLWTNTCCGHPRPGEPLVEAAQRRLWEEMHIRCPLYETFHFSYQANLDHGLIEHELDHVFFGNYEESPIPNPEEVHQWEWCNLEDILKNIRSRPHHYTYWFQSIIGKIHAIRLCETMVH